MTGACLFIEDDLSHAALSIEGRCESWRPPADDRAGSASTDEQSLAERALARAASLAVWTRERVSRGQSLRLCAGVSRAVCERVRAPSSTPAVVTAALAQRDDDAGDRLASLTIEPIQTPALGFASDAPDEAQERARSRLGALGALLRREDRRAPEASVVTVLEAPTAGVRLAMDALERAGRPVEEAITLWHALLLAHASPEVSQPASGVRADANGQSGPATASTAPIHAVVQVDAQGGVVWAWGVGGALATGGCLAPRARRSRSSSSTSLGASSELSPGHEERDDAGPACDCSRLLLDWLSWSAQLEMSPSVITVVSPRAAAIARELTQAWPGASAQPIVADDPALETLSKLTAPKQSPAEHTSDADEAGVDDDAADSSRRRKRVQSAPAGSRFEALTRRPSRRRRRAGLWWCAAMVVVAAAAAIDGGRNLLAAGQLREQARDARNQLRERAVALELSSAEARAPVRSLLGRLQVAQAAFKPPAPPPPPRPIREEIRRLVAAVATVEGAVLDRVSLDTNTGLATISVPSVEVGERLQLAIRQGSGRVRWSGRFVGVAPALTVRLSPTWESFQ